MSDCFYDLWLCHYSVSIFCTHCTANWKWNSPGRVNLCVTVLQDTGWRSTIKVFFIGTAGADVFKSNIWILTSLNQLHCFTTCFICAGRFADLVAFFSPHEICKTKGGTTFVFRLVFFVGQRCHGNVPHEEQITCFIFFHPPALCSHPHLDYIQSCDSSPQGGAC